MITDNRQGVEKKQRVARSRSRNNSPNRLKQFNDLSDIDDTDIPFTINQTLSLDGLTAGQ